jgi:hypothetical protein
MMELVTQHPEAVVYYCCARCIDAYGCELPQVLGKPVGNTNNLYQILLRANFLIPSTIIMNRSLVVDAGLFDVAFRRLQDWELWIRLLKAGYQFFGLSEILVHYRIHSNNLSTDPAGGQKAALALANKHFGPDDGQWESWPQEKRRAYGGIYRYHTLTSVQRQNDWQAGALHLRRSLQVDPTIAVDLDFFYDLALGTQPVGLRGTTYRLHLDNNAANINSMLIEVFKSPGTRELKSLRRETYGTACFAVGLVAYNSRQFPLSKQFLSKALYYRPNLVGESRVMGNLIKSLISPSMLERMKGLKNLAQNWWRSYKV